MRRTQLCALLLASASACAAAAPPRVDLVAAPAWAGWSRPDRATELSVRLTSDSATRATLTVLSGRQTVRSELDLEAGRTVRLHIPLRALDRAEVSVAAAGGGGARREVVAAQSEVPLLGLALAAGGAGESGARLAGFHTVPLAADALPRSTAGYAGIDALILDAATLAALDPRQLAALLAHLAGCGRTIVLDAEPQVARLLQGAGGCGGQALMSATTMAEAIERLDSSLAAPRPVSHVPGVAAGLAHSDPTSWHRAAAALVVCFAAVALGLMFSAPWLAGVALPALTAAAVPLLLPVMQPAAQLVVWAASTSGAPTAQYEARQLVQGVAREVVHLPIPPLLAPGALPCDAAAPMTFDFDAASGQLRAVQFETRLFGQLSLCYSGSFPITRSFTVEPLPDGSRRVHNTGNVAWPSGWLLAGGRVYDLPALGAGAAADTTTTGVATTLTAAGPASRAARAALTRLGPEETAALWRLDLSGVTEAPTESTAWLLVTIPGS